jgi:hypothetical protein
LLYNHGTPLKAEFVGREHGGPTDDPFAGAIDTASRQAHRLEAR